MAAQSGPSPQAVSRWSAIITPLLITAVVVWATYVAIGKIAFQRLIEPGDNGGIAVVVVHCALLFLMAACYLRILLTIWSNPGVVPLGETSASAGRRKSKGQPVLGGGVDSDGRSWAERLHEEKMLRLEKFRPREVFVCDYEGLPPWCDKCANWKPDRTHHCSDLGRCVRRMDHFCPWVGGIVSETTLKFFIQFTFYGALFALSILITAAILVARDLKSPGHVNAELAVLLGFACFFTLFAAGIFGNTLYMTLYNLTTVEHLNRGNATYHLSVLVTPSWFHGDPTQPYPFRTTSYPGAPGAIYAILMTRPGDNPWDLGRLGNLKTVMGERLSDWFVPLKYSPCTNHDREESEFKLGPVVKGIKMDAAGY